MVVTVEELQRLEDIDIRDLKREELDNAGDVVIDKTKPANLRMKEFLAVTYSKTSEKTLEDKMIQLAKRMTRIPL